MIAYTKTEDSRNCKVVPIINEKNLLLQAGDFPSYYNNFQLSVKC